MSSARWSRATSRRRRPRGRSWTVCPSARTSLWWSTAVTPPRGRACATSRTCTCWSRTSSTRTTSCAPTTSSSPRVRWAPSWLAPPRASPRRRLLAMLARTYSQLMSQQRPRLRRPRASAPRLPMTRRTPSDHVEQGPRDILLAPVVSEKSYGLLDEGKYTFIVDPRANKTEIKIAVERVFGVKVDSVNTLNRQGKTRRTKFGLGKSKNTKRAIVTLKEGSIDIFGGSVG